MAIRLRKVGGRLIAICAARSIAKPGDVYLDDAAHQALSIKFDLDHASEGRHEAWSATTEEAALMEQEESNNPAREWWDRTYGPNRIPDPKERLMSEEEMMKYFGYSHLPPHLQEVSKPFCELAWATFRDRPACAQRDVALQRLLEAKDAAVRTLL